MRLLLTVTVLLTLALGLVRGKGSPLPADNLYQIVWQMPHNLCRRFETENSTEKMDFRLDDFGILANPRGRFDGEYTSIFYHYGRFPQYAFSNPDAIDNGGIPQRGDYEIHFEDALNDIVNEIPNPYFNGLAVINHEEWQPLFKRNFGVKAIYQDKSLEYYMDRFPDEMDEDRMFNRTIAEFEYWAKLFMLESLNLGKRMRPEGKWGYYAYPYCYNYKKPTPDQCTQSVRDGNTEMTWLWNASTVILPSIYIFEEYDNINRARFLYSQIEEGIRVASLSDKYTPVYIYTKMKYNMSVPVFTYRTTDMYASLRMPADFGVEGVILWGSDLEFKEEVSCHKMKRYITKVIGPYAKKVNKWAKECSEQVCSKHGRCAHRGALDRQYRTEMYRLWGSQLNDFSIYEEDGSTKYRCRCFSGWSGNKCRKKIKKND